MNKTSLKYLLSFYLLLTLDAQAQQYPCGTTVTQEQKTFEESLTEGITQIAELNRTFHLAIYIVKDNKGQPNVNLTDMNTAITQVNTAFERIKTTFVQYSLSYIDNYNFDEIHLEKNEQDMIAQYAVRNVINIYLVFRLYNNAGQEICGYTYYPAEDRDVILLKKDCLDGSFLTEQLGHFFNLYHTHETTFGNEVVNRSNCLTAGDRCCDTPADPILSQKVSPDCQYNGTNKDSMDDYYVPTTANFMSFSPLNCKCFFSDQQYLRMINCMLREKKKLW